MKLRVTVLAILLIHCVSGVFAAEKPRSGSVRFDVPEATKALSGKRISRLPPMRMPSPRKWQGRQHSGRLEPHASGDIFPLHFSSSRLIPSDARLSYPYSTVGKLVVNDDVGPIGTCTGAVISPRVVLTAGHCVYDNMAKTPYSRFRFIPGYHQGDAPYGTWTSGLAYATAEWVDGSDGPNRADFGVIVISDQDGVRLGEVTGWLGWALNKIALDDMPNDILMLGYPDNLDGGQQMHQVSSGQAAWWDEDEWAAAYGSDMKAGSSGGPWVQNFGQKSLGQGRMTRNKAMNLVVGVTAWGVDPPEILALCSSVPKASFRKIINEACAQAQGNCKQKGKPSPPMEPEEPEPPDDPEE